MKAKKTILFILVPVLLIVSFALKTLWNAGQFKRIVPFSLYRCVPVTGFPGPEDVVIDRAKDTALISFTDRRAAMAGTAHNAGIIAYSLTTPGAKPVLVKTDFKGAFTPHGIHLYRAPDGTKLLFVVNMGMDSHFFESTGSSTVEIFAYRDGRLYHRETVAGPELSSPNDILAVGPRQFYVSIDHGATSVIGKKLENYLQLPISYILYYDGKGFKKAAGGIAYANGIAISPDGATLYVGATVGRKVHVYARNARTGELIEKDAVSLGTGVDNLDVDADGSIWAGCHAKLLSFVAHSKDAAALSPSEVVRIRPLEEGGYDVTRVYLNGGGELSGSSAAAGWRNRLLIGAVYDERFLDCALLPAKSPVEAER
ncbi:MAG: SMP-30/gluconolactonase/LRE family protein [Spirochaetes bacterium]|jgi:arylesterase/paraoxonase|nr:SMP-30/gluconolactonase/LRE family protein [Spirochaetota bacterium]